MKSYLKLFLNSLSFIAFVTAFFVYYIYEGWSSPLDTVCVIVILTWLAFLLLLYYRHIRTNRRVSTRKTPAPDYLELQDLPDSNTILYLRPFKIDDQSITEIEYGGVRYKSIEPLLCQMFSDAGMPVAIGNPNKTAEQDGAVHITPSDSWKDIVTELLERSSHVILYVDFTEGVKWELSEALSGYKHKLILLPKLYNTREKLSYSAALGSLFGITYLGYILRYRRFTFFRKWRRKKAYYQQWAATFPDFRFLMDDTVSAVIFEGDKAVPFYAEKPNLESQFQAIHRAINYKLGVPMPPDVFVKKKEKPLFALCADMDMQAIPGNIVPYAMGRVLFYEEGFRYDSPLMRLMSHNISMRHHYRRHLNYQKGQLWPYSAIEEIRPLDKTGLEVVCEKANGSSKLVFPTCHAGCTGSLQAFLEQKRSGVSDSVLINQLAEFQQKQEADYAIATLLLEVFGFALSALLLPFSLFNNHILFSLLVCIPIWHINLATLYGFFYSALNSTVLSSLLRRPAALLRLKPPAIPQTVNQLVFFGLILLHVLLFAISFILGFLLLDYLSYLL